jgi:hypothetical protein
MRGRSFLVPKSMLRIVEARTEKNEILIWPLSGEVKDSKHLPQSSQRAQKN